MEEKFWGKDYDLRESVIIEKVEDFVANKSEHKYTYKGYYLEAEGSFGNNWISVAITAPNGQRFAYHIIKNQKEIEQQLGAYIYELKGLYNEAIQECINETIGGSAELLGLDKLEKLFKDDMEKVFKDVLNKILNDNNMGITYEQMKEGYELITSAKKCIEKSSGYESNPDNALDAIKSMKSLYKKYAGLEALLE